MDLFKNTRKETAKQLKNGIKWDIQYTLGGLGLVAVGFGVGILGYNIGGSVGTVITLVGFAIIAVGVLLAGGLSSF